MKYKLKVYSIWEFGKRTDAEGKPHQEDSLFPEYGKQRDSDRLFILCDGMGGHDAGEVASATVCEAMSRSILDGTKDPEGEFSVEDFDRALNAAFDALDAKDNGAAKKMGTTMTFLKLHKHGAFIAHMGDSRVYHIRPGKDGAHTEILFETSDHSLVNDLVRAEEITKEEALHHRQRNVITRAMQPNMERRPKADIYRTDDIRPGDFFYLCSDGMLEEDAMNTGESLKNIFSDAITPAQRKVEVLRGATGENKDNHTAFIIHIEDVILPTPSHKDEIIAQVVPAGDKVFSKPATKDSKQAKKDSKPRKSNSHFRGLLYLFAALMAVAAAAFWFLRTDTATPDEPAPIEEVKSHDGKNTEKGRKSHNIEIPGTDPDKAANDKATIATEAEAETKKVSETADKTTPADSPEAKEIVAKAFGKAQSATSSSTESSTDTSDEAVGNFVQQVEDKAIQKTDTLAK